MNIPSIDTLLEKCYLKDKYLHKFQQEGVTLERFEQVSSLSQGAFIQVFLDKMNMTCGDYICLMQTLDMHSLKRQNTNSNSKLALYSSEKDIYRTPPAIDILKKSRSSQSSSIQSHADPAEFPSSLTLMKVQTRDQSTQTTSPKPQSAETKQQMKAPLQVGVKRTHQFSFGEAETKVFCQNKKRAQKLLEKSSVGGHQSSPMGVVIVNEGMASKPMTPTFQNFESLDHTTLFNSVTLQ